MDSTSDDIIAREKALADFDHARDDFEDAFDKAPDQALGYKPEGDDYSIGYLLTHITGVLTKYIGVVDKIREAGYGEVRLAGDGSSEVVTDQAIDRAASLTQMEAAHDTLAAKLREMAYEDFTRQAPVYYPGSTEPYPTGASDIIGWVTDHYREHVPHVASLLEEYSNAKS
jgi:hypothetical protein